jgi:hypothetical protein
MIQTSLDTWTDLPVQQRTQLLIAALIAMTGAPLQLVEEQILQRIVNAFLELGRDHPK